MSLLRCPKASAVGWAEVESIDDKNKTNDEEATKQNGSAMNEKVTRTAPTDEASSTKSDTVPNRKRKLPGGAKEQSRTSFAKTGDDGDDGTCIEGEDEHNNISIAQPEVTDEVETDETNQDAKNDTDESDICTLVFDPPGSEIVITGTAVVTVLAGSVEILGYTVDSADELPYVHICSPDGSWSSALTILDTSPAVVNASADTSAKSRDGLTRIQLSPLASGGSEDTMITFHIKKRSDIRSALVVADRWRVSANAVLSDMGQKVHTSATDCSTDPKRILVCGAKGVGKSTYVRYIVNKILTRRIDQVDRSKRNRVAVLDLDVGQPELGPPGLLTLTVLERPLLSPPHAHLICNGNSNDSDCANFEAASDHISARFFGHVSSKADPTAYCAAITSLVGQYESLAREYSSGGDSLPLVVNTAGWIKGMGFEILSSIVDVIRPGHIIQIVGAARAKFFDLTTHAQEGRSIHVVEAFGRMSCLPTESGMTPPPSRSASPFPSAYETGTQRTPFEDKSPEAPMSTSAANSNLRSLRIAAYFLGGFDRLLATGAKFWPAAGGIYDPQCSVASKLATMTPYLVPFCSILVHSPNLAECRDSRQAEDLMLKSLNGAVVGLCQWDQDVHSVACEHNFNSVDSLNSLRLAPSYLNASLLPCTGLGIVRGIDRVKRCFYILTPLSSHELCKTNVIVRGRIQLPMECVFRGVHSESFPYQCCDGIASGIGDDVMKSKNAPTKK